MIAAFFSNLWAKVAGYAIVVATVLGILAAAYSKGKTDQKSKQTLENLKSVRTAKEIDDEINSLGSNDIDAEYVKWLRDK